MSLVFDISPDEMPIFLAEADEHLQVLDELLVRAERTEHDPEALQAAFRAAHTLKGMAGMIGHNRMVQLTHALETAFDGLRKNTLSMSSVLVDLCLESIDGLRLLREEVVTGSECGLDLDELVKRFNDFSANGGSAPIVKKEETVPAPVDHACAEEHADGQIVEVKADIDPKSIASAARAFQLMLALQELGSVLEMNPSQEQIETAAPVKQFSARLRSDKSGAEIEKALRLVSEVMNLQVSATSNGNNGHRGHNGNGSNGQAAVEQQGDNGGSRDAEVEAQTSNIKAVEEKLTSMSATLYDRQRKGVNERKAEMTVRTSVERLDSLMGLVGELITDRNHLYQMRGRMEMEARGNDHVEELAETISHLGRITDQLQEEVMRIRMLPVGNVFHKFPRLVRDLAQKIGKKIELVIEGEDTELDRSVIDEINDPLIHLIRNAVDHGIEMPEERRAAGKPEVGQVKLTARHEQGRIILTVEDDGHGIDAARLRATAIRKGLITEEEARELNEEKSLDLIFLSGLSTSKTVTDISGRGVGMDIVRNNIQRINGTISVETKFGYGSQFQIILPLTLAIVPTLLVKVDSIAFAIPLVMVAETLRLKKEDISTIRGKPVTLLRGKVLPLVEVCEAFDLCPARANKGYSFVVVVHSGKQRVGLVVDAFMGEEEVVVKSLSALVGNIPGVSSAAILGDGQVALIVDVPGLLSCAGIN